MTDDPLWRVLQAAHSQAMLGKGKERHGSDLPFEQQPIMAIARMQDGSIDGHLFQVAKKAQEAGRMAKSGDGEAATRELYGVIVYAAAAAMMLGERAAGRMPQMRVDGIDLKNLRPGAVDYVMGDFPADEVRYVHRASGAEFTAPRGATPEEIERAHQEREETERAWQQQADAVLAAAHEKARKAAIDRAGEMLRAGEFKPVDDGPAAQQEAIDRALKGAGRLGEHEIDHNILRAQLRKQREEDDNG